MDFRGICTSQALSALAFGLVMLLTPGPLLMLFSFPSDPATLVLGRMLGGVLFALGATLYAARDVADRPSRIRLCVGNLVCDAAIAVFIAAAVAGGQIRPLGWGLVAIFAGNALSWILAVRPAPSSG